MNIVTIERIGQKPGVLPGQATDGYRVIVDEATAENDEHMILDAVDMICSNTKDRLRFAFEDSERPTNIEIRWGTVEEEG